MSYTLYHCEDAPDEVQDRLLGVGADISTQDMPIPNIGDTVKYIFDYGRGDKSDHFVGIVECRQHDIFPKIDRYYTHVYLKYVSHYIYDGY